MVNWDDNKKRKDFREALQQAYPDETDLRIFVDEALNKNLASIAGGNNLRAIIFNLVDWSKAQNRLDELYEAFKEQNHQHSAIATLEQQSFVLQVSNLSQEDWDTLFRLFLPDDLAGLKRAFEQGFKKALSITFKDAQGQPPPLVELTQIRELLERYDANPKGLVLAVRFVECAIAELRRSNEGNDRDLTALEAWRDRIAQKHKISVEVPELTAPTACHAYLLVALKESGRVTQEGADVTVFVELRVTGELAPIAFEATRVICPFDRVASYVSDWIQKAEEALPPYNCDEVTLEVFLSCSHLEEDVANWEVQNKAKRPRPLGKYRGLLVRSFNRASDEKLQKSLEVKWQLLKSLEANTVSAQFHWQEHCPTPGDLSTYLKHKLGLQLLAELPTDRTQRMDILDDIIDAAVPIALWSTEFDQGTAAELKTQFNDLLRDSQLTNFADLAHQWRMKRAQPDNGVIKNIRLLCDCPDRWPTLPDLKRTEDLLVS